MGSLSAKPLITFDRGAFIKAFRGAMKKLEEAEALGKELGGADIQRIFFTGCGAPHYMMRSLAYWAKKYSIQLDIRNYFSAELLHQEPVALDKHTLVLLGSHSGKTQETVAAAEYLRDKACRTVAVTQLDDSPLGQNAQNVTAYGKTKEGYFSSYILAQMFLSAFLKEKEPAWKLHRAIKASLPNLPDALADAKEDNIMKAATQARDFAKDRIMYVIGGGPMFITAYTFASCFLMEMQRMHAHPLEAAEFFHGPFEVFDEETPIIILVGEGPSRPEEERVVRFCKKYAKRFIVMDSRKMEMAGIQPEVRPLVAPFVIDAALTALVESLAIAHDFPLTIRRYMGKVAY